MNNKRFFQDWIHHVPPITVALLALVMLIITPIWAIQWYQQPFVGAFFEPNNVVSQIDKADWPLVIQGVKGYDHLLTANGIKIQHISDLNSLLKQTQGQEISMSFERQDGTQFEVSVVPTSFKLSELLTYFGVPYLVGLAFLIIGFWAYRTGRSQSPARAFFTFTAAVAITTSAYFDLNTSQHLTVVWALSLPVAAGAMTHLSFVFPEPMPFVRRNTRLRLLPWGLTFLLTIPIIRELFFPTSPWGYFGPFVLSYAYIGIAILLFVALLVIRIIRSSSPMIRQQSRVIIFGVALAFGPSVFTFFLPSMLGMLPKFQVGIGFPPMVLFPLSVAYAIVRYRMLDVDRFLNRSLTYVLTATGAVGIFYLLIALISFLIPSPVRSDNPLVVAIYLFILVVTLNPLRNFMQTAIDRVFYRTQADYQRVLSKLSQELGNSPEMENTLSMLEQEINAALAPEKILIYLFDDDESMYRPHGTESASGLALPAESRLVEQITQSAQAIWFPPGRPFPSEWGNGDIAIAEELKCRVFVPLRYENRSIGFLALGRRRSGDPYSSNDLEFLNAVAGQSSLALENVRLFANLQDTLNQTLEMKNLMDDIFQSMSSGVITTDIRRQITLFNKAAEQILGTSVDTVLGKTIREALEPLGPQFNVITNATIEDGIPTLGQELTPIIPSRGPLHLRLSWTPLRGARFSTKGATIVIDDLTEQRQLEAERERIRQTFGRVVAPRVRDRLLEDPSNLRLDGIRQPLTVLFADIHNFTPFSERTQPENLFEILNSYLSLAAQAVLEEEGTLDKFMGDAVMAFWNAPDCQDDQTLRAARAALAMDQAIRKHRSSLAEDHQLYFSVGINLGDAIVGNVGTTDLFNYTAIGDSVNYAQRLESIAKPGQILLSEEAYQAIADQVIANELPPVQVKGKSKPAVVYELLRLKS